MDISLWLGYVGVISLLIAFPGPSALLCLSHGVKYGKGKTVSTVIGGAIAALSLMFLSAIGLGVLLTTSAKAFLVVKLVGAAYLAYLGFCMWRDRNEVDEINQIDTSPKGNISSLSLFKKGYMVGISNPKDLLFFAALFPNFVQPEQPQLLQFIILALTWAVIDSFIMFVYSSVGKTITPWFENAVNKRRFNTIVGGAFVAAGSVLAIESTRRI